MESCAPGLTSWNFFLFSPVCKPKAVGKGIPIRVKVEPKGRVIFLNMVGIHLTVEKRTKKPPTNQKAP